MPYESITGEELGRRNLAVGDIHKLPYDGDAWDEGKRRSGGASNGLILPDPKVSMLVPWRSVEPTRVANWAWLQKRWAARWPTLEIVIGTDDGTDPFNACAAINDAAQAATGDVFLITDADVVTADIDELKRCAEMVYRREVPWMLPWERMVCLNDEDTRSVLESDPARERIRISEQMENRGERRHNQPPGSIQCVSREAFYTIGGYDERFRGWGGGDSSFFWAMDTIIGPHKRGAGKMYALWHERHQFLAGGHWKRWGWPGQEFAGEATGSGNPVEFEYKAAWRNPTAMRRVLAELVNTHR
jgi:hypothetical protein